MKQLEVNWMQESLKENCKIKELGTRGERIRSCALAYRQVFNGPPFYENWTEEEAISQVQSYVDENASILVSDYQEAIVGFSVSICKVPNDQKKYVPYPENLIRYIEEIGVVEAYQKRQLASEMVRNIIVDALGKGQNYIAYRTNAMRYFEPQRGESFEAGVMRIQKEDKRRRKNKEPILIPRFSLSEKQEFINQYIDLLQERKDLDVSNSNALFRSIFETLEFCKIGDNYTFQEDPSNNGNDRIFPIIDLSKQTLTKQYVRKGGRKG